MTNQYSSPYDYYKAISEHDYEKPIVEYIPTALDIIVGERAYVKTVNHPFSDLNKAPFVMTTMVESYDVETGSFETKNSRYVLKK
jgi:hypothetical protein